MAGRPRKEEPEVALAAAMSAFWAKGFEATSMADLVAATGLHKASLYQTFGDKQALFSAALKRYLQQMINTHREIAEKESDPVEAIFKTTSHILKLCGQGRGCLAVNTLIEVAPHDSEIGTILDKHRVKAAKMLASHVERAKENGQIGHIIATDAAVSMMMTFINGLTTELAAGLSVAKAIDMAHVHIKLILCLKSH